MGEDLAGVPAALVAALLKLIFGQRAQPVEEVLLAGPQLL
jgi:hypothetical protein